MASGRQRRRARGSVGSAPDARTYRTRARRAIRQPAKSVGGDPLYVGGHLATSLVAKSQDFGLQKSGGQEVPAFRVLERLARLPYWCALQALSC